MEKSARGHVGFPLPANVWVGLGTGFTVHGTGDHWSIAGVDLSSGGRHDVGRSRAGSGGGFAE